MAAVAVPNNIKELRMLVLAKFSDSHQITLPSSGCIEDCARPYAVPITLDQDSRWGPIVQRLPTIKYDTVVDVAPTAVVIAAHALLATVVHPIVVPMLRTVCSCITLDWSVICVNARVISTNQTSV